MNSVAWFKTPRLISTSLLALAALAVALVGIAIPASAQGFVYDFPTNTGAPVFPNGALAQGRDGNLYGMALDAWSVSQGGAIYRITPSGAESGVYVLPNDGSQGFNCYPGLTLGTDGNFYGACVQSATGYGTVFRVTPDGTFNLLHTFSNGTDGEVPYGPPVEGTDGNFYGVTYGNGSGIPGGTVYKITPSGTLTTVHTFSLDGNGTNPQGPLFVGSDGNFYGTTTATGTGGYGSVFKMTAKGKITVLHSFTSAVTDGGTPQSGVIQAADGSFYGATFRGGTSNEGTLFKVTAAKKFTLLHGFDLASDYGIYPAQPVVQATDGNIYGVATSYASGGYANNGSVYKMGTAKKGKFSVVFEFANGPVVPVPDSPLLAHTNGILYGSTDQGGPTTSGTIYSVIPGLQPFVTIQTKSGKVGTSVNILGQGFNSATSVAFNGTAAIFSVVSDTFMTATIPSGSTTGYVTVAEPGGTLKSNFKFKVKP
jgi:uncharacterized repeat protein (TIGR03803 family)